MLLSDENLFLILYAPFIKSGLVMAHSADFVGGVIYFLLPPWLTEGAYLRDGRVWGGIISWKIMYRRSKKGVKGIIVFLGMYNASLHENINRIIFGLIV